ncbi:Polyketide cyclase / dehydrase and lipid transport [Asanoa hainanensis]|uniref:Polyketide cyclase / dehydrase and lipid transport n=1 Tax=Asanoa hainanensis TaxID=560556 RepID=A0A239LMY2_9ACTN|nr:SRPBCC family protein [Asanoa hainanensis]SNT31173.1 Polyketide cyclase / dehydrase and lipid transport [Asanoa hainanensis]
MSQSSNGNGHGTITGKLVEGLKDMAGAVADKAVSAVNERVSDLTDRIVESASGGEEGGPRQAAVAKGVESLQKGDSPVKAALGAGVTGGKEEVKQTFGKGGGNGGKKNDLKVTNIVESIEVGVPVTVAYNQWTEFKTFPSFMKKVEDIDQKSEEQLTWKAQVFWSHRTWESTITEQVPDERIVWSSKGDKGSVDGTVTFHEVTPDLTRILVVLEYHPQGFVEQTGNLWRAPGRRARLELKHFVRHVMRETILNPDDVKGWRGEIRDGQVVQQDNRGDGDGPDAEDQAEEQKQEEREKEKTGAKA